MCVRCLHYLYNGHHVCFGDLQVCDSSLQKSSFQLSSQLTCTHLLFCFHLSQRLVEPLRSLRLLPIAIKEQSGPDVLFMYRNIWGIFFPWMATWVCMILLNYQATQYITVLEISMSSVVLSLYPTCLLCVGWECQVLRVQQNLAPSRKAWLLTSVWFMGEESYHLRWGKLISLDSLYSMWGKEKAAQRKSWISNHSWIHTSHPAFSNTVFSDSLKSLGEGKWDKTVSGLPPETFIPVRLRD